MHPCVNQSNSSTTPTGFRYVPYTRNHNAQQCDIKVFCKINTQERPMSPVMLGYEWEAMLCGGEWRELRGWS